MTFTLYEPLQTTQSISATRRVRVAVKQRCIMMIVGSTPRPNEALL